MVHQPVDRGGGRHRVLEDLLPAAEHQVAGDQHRAPFIAFGDQSEQDLGFFRALLHIADVVQNQEFERIEAPKLLRQYQIALGGEAVAFAVEQQQGMITGGLEVAVVGAVLLLAVDRNLG